jgi:hypothetical protein
MPNSKNKTHKFINLYVHETRIPEWDRVQAYRKNQRGNRPHSRVKSLGDLLLDIVVGVLDLTEGKTDTEYAREVLRAISRS